MRLCTCNYVKIDKTTFENVGSSCCLTELHQKTNSITRELVFWVKFSIFIASLKEIRFFLI
ncbi:hypothetical protein BK789_19220 [Bacillus thuringiensis serovar darmstadiensis]|nr:hypothetical protein BK789_19220 [Bacillus thuringiensis serovar darmstadiensis]